MTLHARLELALAAEFRGVHNRTYTRFDVPGFHCIDVRLTGTVAALAIDPIRQGVSELWPFEIVLDCPAWIAVVARHAARVDGAPEIEMRRPVVSRAHLPISLSRRSDG